MIQWIDISTEIFFVSCSITYYNDEVNFAVISISDIPDRNFLGTFLYVPMKSRQVPTHGNMKEAVPIEDIYQFI